MCAGRNNIYGYMHRQGSLTGNHNARTQFTQKPKGTLKLYIVQHRWLRKVVQQGMSSETVIQATGDVPVYQQSGIGTIVGKVVRDHSL